MISASVDIHNKLHSEVNNICKICVPICYTTLFLIVHCLKASSYKYYIANVFQVKEIEKRDSVLTPKQQLERLLRPGSTYFNLNPFEVLQVEPDASLDEIKKKYRRLSILVHPDKNIVSETLNNLSRLT